MLRPLFKIRSVRTRLLGARGGNVAMLFGLLLVPILIGAGMAIDLSRSSQARTVMQEAADAALLRAAQTKSRDPSTTDAELTALARKIFDAAMAKQTGVTVKDFAVKFDPVSHEFALDIHSGLSTSLMGAVGVKTMPISILSAVQLGDPPYLEVVLALDNTGSMNEKGKLADLKNSAADLVESVFQQPNAGVMVGLVPFAQYVNVGETHKSEPWMGATGNGWKGCVGSRAYPANLEDSGYAPNPVPGLNGAPCPNPLMPLSTDKTKILAAVKDMKGGGYTYIPSGLAWAWRLLTPITPFAEGLAYEDLKEVGGVKSIVLLTDGENTRAPDYPTHNSANQSLADDLMIRLCDAIKKDEIVIYTIAFDVSDATIRGLLEDCATTPGHYFDPSNDDQLAVAFANIASSLRGLSLSK